MFAPWWATTRQVNSPSRSALAKRGASAYKSDQARVPTVLVVDDDAEWQKYATLTLGQDYPVLSSSSGEDALRIARNARPDVIILDVTMAGGMDGFTVFCELRKNPDTAHIKVLMLTEVNRATKLRLEAGAMEKYFGDGPQAFLEKPINPDRLRQAVTTVLGLVSSQKEY
ncbi:MAG: response regulator [Lentisphaerae bacterium]|nr:response regulator [Lentisphaerota bacterium]